MGCLSKDWFPKQVGTFCNLWQKEVRYFFFGSVFAFMHPLVPKVCINHSGIVFCQVSFVKVLSR